MENANKWVLLKSTLTCNSLWTFCSQQSSEIYIHLYFRSVIYLVIWSKFDLWDNSEGFLRVKLWFCLRPVQCCRSFSSVKQHQATLPPIFYLLPYTERDRQYAFVRMGKILLRSGFRNPNLLTLMANWKQKLNCSYECIFYVYSSLTRFYYGVFGFFSDIQIIHYKILSAVHSILNLLQ